MENKNTQRNAPNRSHLPILTVDYEQKDLINGYGDARFLDIGQSTWNKEDISAKIWRWANEGQRWSRQSEEIPLSRVLDLAILISAVATDKTSILEEFYQKEEQKEFLQYFLKENMQNLGPKFDELRRILQPQTQQIENTKIPNIFSFATSELSQDAMFAWLLSWAAPQYKEYDAELHSVALRFVKLLTDAENVEIKRIEVGRQWKHIDIFAKINDDIFLAIEDKTGTTVHGEQLKEYKDAVNKEYPNYRKCFAYVKTGNEPNAILKKVISDGYKVISRKEILHCLNEYTGNNLLLCNYREHIQIIEDLTESFLILPVSQWRGYAWEGFYKKLEEKEIIDNWAYVSNPSGGFLGAWWYWKNFYAGNMYLQFEQGKLCFKICLDCDKNLQSKIRNKCSEELIKIAEKVNFIKINKPARFGAGEYMTISIINQKDIFGDGVIDMEAIIKKLKICEEILDKCCASLNTHDK